MLTCLKSSDKNQDKFNKCMVAVEILNRNYKLPSGMNSFEIKDALSIKELIGFIEQSFPWPDKLIELELWSNIAVLSCKSGQTENLRFAHSKALETISYFEKKKTENK